MSFKTSDILRVISGRAYVMSTLLVCSICFAFLTWWLDREMLLVSTEAYLSLASLLSNSLPGVLLALIFTAVSRRPIFSFLLVTILHVVIYRISTLKVAILEDFLGIQDVFFVTNFDVSSFVLFSSYLEAPLLTCALSLAVILALGLAFKLERPAFTGFPLLRFVVLFVPVVSLMSFQINGSGWKELYSKENMRPSRFGNKAAILHRGLISSLVYSQLELMSSELTFDGLALSNLFDVIPSVPPGEVSDDVKPDIIVILSESLFDPRDLVGMEELQDYVPHMRAALEVGHGGNMVPPTFGAGTIKTEFEVITGMSIKAFPNDPFPYVSLVRKEIPGLVSHLKTHGYQSVAVHGNDGSFWNRRNAYKSVGFDKFISKGQFPEDIERQGRWIPDSAMMDIVLSELDSESAPKVVLAISMEAHGPYSGRPKGAYKKQLEQVAIPESLSNSASQELRNYLYHIREADAAFGALIEKLKQRSRPSVVLMFGDHLPGFKKVYQEMRFVNGGTPQSQYTPWVMLRTDDERPFIDNAQPLEAWMLPGKVLQLAGLADDPYFVFTNSLVDVLLRGGGEVLDAQRGGIFAASVARLEGEFDGLYSDRAQEMGGQL